MISTIISSSILVYICICVQFKGRSCYETRTSLIGHWKMDEDSGIFVDDDSGHGLHATVKETYEYKDIIQTTRGKYTRGRYYNGNQKNKITIRNNPIFAFGYNSFTMMGWLKIEDYNRPYTTFAVQQGNGCSYVPGRSGFTPGWDIGHGLNKVNNYTRVCIRDNLNVKVYDRINHNPEHVGKYLLNKWTHYAVVFDRKNEKIFLYINGVKQTDSADISSVKGSIDNTHPLEFGYIYGWKTKGSIDEYRLYNVALNEREVSRIYNDHRE